MPQLRGNEPTLGLNSINENMLYWKDPSGMLLRCLDKEESIQVMHQFHSSNCGGHHY
jgi:hypothetical protein